MARIDSILNIVIQQGADELRLGTDKAPRMFSAGAPKRLVLPETPDDMLRHLLGPLLSPEREAQLRGEPGRVELSYEAPSLGSFAVTLLRRGGEPPPDGPFPFEVLFVKGARRVTEPPPPPPLTPPPPAHRARASEPPGARAPSEPPHARQGDGIPTPGVALASLLAQAASYRASDVHLLTGDAPVARVDGRLVMLSTEPIDTAALLAGCLTASAEERLAEGRSADIAFDVEGVGRFRLNVYRAAAGLCAAFRILPRVAPSLADLRLPAPLHELAELPHGLVIVCGPTGSGKSTTLAALANEVLRRRSAILLTLEDPIEYLLDARGTHGMVRQREVGRDVRDFPTGLRDALREDPDVLLIGEMRDPETISLALTAAETGHLVLTSLHSRSAASAVERIVDAYPAGRHHQIRVQLADSLRAVVAQRLVRRAHGGGRAAPLEVLRGTHGVASMIREGKTAQLASAIQSARKEGMLPLERCLADMCKTGEITVEDARAVANDPTALVSYLQ